MKEVEDYILRLAEPGRTRCARLRRTILGAAPEVEEQFKWGRPCYRTSKLFCYLQACRGSLNLGFQDGAELPDPHRMLEGTGVRMRHVKLVDGKDVPWEEVEALIAAALSHAAS